MGNNFLQILWSLVSTIVIGPVIMGSLVVAVSRANKRLSIVLGGFYGQVILGGIGVIIHELSHLVVALLFGHRIDRVSLLHIPDAHDPNDRGLGYVSHVWNDDSLYQKIGNVFIGIAPVIGCSLAMVISTRFLVPTLYDRWLLAIGGGTITNQPLLWWHVLIWLVLMINISVGGFDLSGADLQNSRQGLIALGVVLIMLAFLLSLVTDNRTISGQLFHLMRPLIMMMSFAIVVNAVLWVLLRLIVVFKKR
ncbi:hypothetical protein HMPREF0501_00625 [Limosilactobacillus coleohominis 101-4-CHN]|uniref:Uncharacterized protein n=1 Tax=Limosilactobacillus coleohominis 101-4-CHN TaxID=575594 RepID=C7XV81_9LACO|nr:hypothetical protein [Limosilactobacillus coleohominis]EEU30247.1 hypothetical protein HMPREF0501_00625 [Limosilactobacillus coleohominis 101-4-CHN]